MLVGIRQLNTTWQAARGLTDPASIAEYCRPQCQPARSPFADANEFENSRFRHLQWPSHHHANSKADGPLFVDRRSPIFCPREFSVVARDRRELESNPRGADQVMQHRE